MRYFKLPQPKTLVAIAADTPEVKIPVAIAAEMP